MFGIKSTGNGIQNFLYFRQAQSAKTFEIRDAKQYLILLYISMYSYLYGPARYTIPTTSFCATVLIFIICKISLSVRIHIYIYFYLSIHLSIYNIYIHIWFAKTVNRNKMSRNKKVLKKVLKKFYHHPRKIKHIGSLHYSVYEIWSFCIYIIDLLEHQLYKYIYISS